MREFALVTAVDTADVVAAMLVAVAEFLVAFHALVADAVDAAAVDVPDFPTALEAIVQTECCHGT